VRNQRNHRRAGSGGISARAGSLGGLSLRVEFSGCQVAGQCGRPLQTGAEGEGKMTGPRPAGRCWTLTDDDMLRKLLASGVKPRLIAQKMKRSIGAIQSRISLLRKRRTRSLPSA
jgi:hypothetical protein